MPIAKNKKQTVLEVKQQLIVMARSAIPHMLQHYLRVPGTAKSNYLYIQTTKSASVLEQVQKQFGASKISCQLATGAIEKGMKPIPVFDSRYRNEDIFEDIYEGGRDSIGDLISAVTENVKLAINGVNNNIGKFVSSLGTPQEILIREYLRKNNLTQGENERYKWGFLKQHHGQPDPNRSDFIEQLKQVDYSNLWDSQRVAPVLKMFIERAPEKTQEAFSILFDESNGDLKSRLQKAQNLFNEIHESVSDNPEFSSHHDERTLSCYLAFYDGFKYPLYKYSYYQKYYEFLNGEPIKYPKDVPFGTKYCDYKKLLEDLIVNYIKPNKDMRRLAKTNAEIFNGFSDDNYYLLAQDILYQMFDQVQGCYEVEVTPSQNVYMVSMNAFGSKDYNRYLDEGKVLVRKSNDSNDENRIASEKHFHDIKIGDYVAVARGKTNDLKVFGQVTSDVQSQDSEWSYRTIERLHFTQKLKPSHPKARWWTISESITCLPIQKREYERTNMVMFNPSFHVHLQESGESVSSESNYQEEIKMEGKMNKIPLNQILFGPPGTGKTYKLSDEYFPLFTTKEDAITKEQFLTEVISNLSWWQVIAIALLEKNDSSVTDILANPYVSRKAELSESKNVRATIWGTLQMHTVNESQTVNYAQRQLPLIFDKNEDKSWRIFTDEAQETSPETFDAKKSVDEFNPVAGDRIQRYDFVTFHQSYSYEDFIEGIKPALEDDEIGYTIEDGVFKRLCAKARKDPDNGYAIFIDEINRGNVSQIFGELITLIEEDKREGAKNELSVTLPYSKQSFSVPANVYIIGTMNTADRSVEALDTALRRRFSFVEMLPDPTMLKTVDSVNLEKLLITLNERIEVLVDRDHTIGHAFFINATSIKGIQDAFANKVIPLLQEYFYGDYKKIELVIGEKFFKAKKEASNVTFAVQADDAYEGVVYEFENVGQMDTAVFKEALNAIGEGIVQ